MKNKHFKLNRYGIILFAAFIVLAALITALAINKSRAEDKPQYNQSEFSFDSSGVSGWWQGATNKVSMALFYKPQDCFTSVSYKTGSVNPNTTLQKFHDNLTRDGYNVKPIKTQTLTMQTSAGKQRYDLHQLRVTGSGAGGKLYGGQEFGYLQLSKGYIKVEGYCKTYEQLPATIPALEAIKFDGN